MIPAMRKTIVPAMRNAHATHVDFGFLRGVISSNPNFMPSNIDMVLERKGNFLFGEWKREDARRAAERAAAAKRARRRNARRTTDGALRTTR